MKKILSIVSLTLCFIMLLSGCSQSEIGLINLYQEFSNEQRFDLTGKIAYSDQNQSFQAHFTGKLDLDKQNPYVDITASFSLPNENLTVNNARIILNNNDLYFSKNMIETFIMLDEPELKSAFEKVTTNTEYFKMDSTNSIEMRLNMYMTTITDKQKEEFLNAFKNLNTDLVKGSNDNYEIYMTEKDIVPLIEKLLTFIQNNKEDLYKYMISLISEYYDDYTSNAIDEAKQVDFEIDFPTKEEVIQEIESQKEEFFDFIDEFAKDFTPEVKDNLNEALNEIAGSYFKETFSKKDEVYYSTIDFLFKTQTFSALGEGANATVLINNEVTFNSEIAAKPVPYIEKFSINNATILDESFEDAINREYYMEYPVKKVEITWYDIENNTAYIDIEKTNGDTAYAIKEMFIQDGRAYLPMRYIVELFGEKVEWDAEKSQANVILDEAKINMSGIIKDGKTYVKIRDFEKLGYKVDYNFTGIEHIATISR